MLYFGVQVRSSSAAVEICIELVQHWENSGREVITAIMMLQLAGRATNCSAFTSYKIDQPDSLTSSCVANR